MHNACMQAIRNLARRVCIPHQDLVHMHLDLAHNHYCMYSRDRSRRT